jgi:hypothetical protein
MADIDTNVTDLEYIFSAPIAAVVKADFMAARQFVEYIEKYGFVHPHPSPAGAEPDPQYFGDLRMVSFTFDQIENGRAERRVMKVPALSLIPMPLLQVKQAEFNYGVRVLSAQRVNNDHKPLRLLQEHEATGLPDPAAYQWRAMLAAGRTQEETRPDLAPHIDANINVKVQVGQADIPAGLANLFALMGENAQVSHALPPHNEKQSTDRKEKP